MTERSYAHLVKPKHKFVPRDEKTPWRMKRVHAGFYEDRDVHGTRIHWQWLLWKWTSIADKIEAEEARGVYDKRTSG